jgi:alpha-ketoglutarate-dependent taurine dioxygenase
MKVSKIPGLGRFGIYIDDVDLNNITDEEWLEIGNLHLQSLVTVIRNAQIDHHTYARLMTQWGDMRYNMPIEFFVKYGKPLKELIINKELQGKDAETFSNARRWQVDKRYPGMIRVTPKKNTKGESIGIFGDGELLWHSNESGDTAFTPAVSLAGWENMVGSCTGFCTSPDWYEKQTESFRSELDEMIIVHNYKPNRVSPIYVEDQEGFYKNSQCPDPDSEVPLVITSPGGIKGLHMASATIDYVKGMSQQESKKLLDRIRSEMFTEEYIYKHWYQSDRDICIFDNSITVHNRELETEHMPNRVGYRIQFDYDKLTGKQYSPFFQQEYNEKRFARIGLLREAMDGMDRAYGK